MCLSELCRFLWDLRVSLHGQGWGASLLFILIARAGLLLSQYVSVGVSTFVGLV